jgi:hypothetical protein
MKPDLIKSQFPGHGLRLEIGRQPEKQAGFRAIQDFTRMPVLNGYGNGFA